MTSRFIKFFFSLCITGMTIASVFIANANADGNTTIQDYSGNVRLFCRTVARLSQASIPEDVEAAGQRNCLVLCRTNGQAPDCSEFELVEAIEGPESRYAFVCPSQEKAEVLVMRLRCQENVKYAELDHVVKACQSESSEVSFRSWGASRMGYGPFLKLARSLDNSQQTIAVIDSGVSKHSVLRERMPLVGYDYIDLDEDPTNDLSGHGTHVAGIIADCTDGTLVMLYPIRVLNGAGAGLLSNVTCAVLEAVNANVDVINLSLESSVMSEALDDAIESARDAGVTVVVAAGNHSCNTAEICPAHLMEKGIIVVGSAENVDGVNIRADYSNYGNSVDFYTYGSDISSCSRNGGYVTQSGTSMAAAHVSGLCALMRIVHGDLPPEILEDRLTALCRVAACDVLDATGLVPASECFRLRHLTLRVGDIIRLPLLASPDTCNMRIEWLHNSDDTIIEIQNGNRLVATATGETELKARCLGFEETCVPVTVFEDSEDTIALPTKLVLLEPDSFSATDIGEVIVPEGIAGIGSRAFSQCSNLRLVHLPDTLTTIGEDLLLHSEQAVILCRKESTALAYCEAHNLQYIAATEKGETE